MPRTGGTWVEESLKSVFGKKSEKVVCDFGWDLPENGIHIPPTVFNKPFKKFTFTFVRHPFDWYISFYQFLKKDEMSWDEFVHGMLGRYTELVKKFEQVDFVGKTENLYFDLCDALDMAGEDYDKDKFLGEHVNRSLPTGESYDLAKDKILEAESYVMEKYYNG